MISDERLREAARQAEENLLASLPKPEECEATFSPEYRRKMKKLARRTDYPVRYWVQKAVACILLTILIGGGSVLAFSTEARAAFVGWIREVYENWFVYQYIGNDQEPSEGVVYFPTWVPNGYELTTTPEAGTHSTAVYENQEGNIIVFNCSMNSESINLQIEYEDTQLSHVCVGDISADLYIDNTSGNTNYLIWENENRQMIFWIISTLDGETMIKIAESVQIMNE